MSARRGTIREVTLGLNGAPVWIGTILATTVGVNSGNTAVPFVIPQGSGVFMETDNAVFWGPIVSTATAAPATANLVTLPAGGGIWFLMPEDLPVIVARTGTGTASVKVFRVY